MTNIIHTNPISHQLGCPVERCITVALHVTRRGGEGAADKRVRPHAHMFPVMLIGSFGPETQTRIYTANTHNSRT